MVNVIAGHIGSRACLVVPTLLASYYCKPGDRGGRTNKFIEDMVIPRWKLVSDCLYVFGIFKPGSATATLGKPFHSFVLEVFEYATGKPAVDYAKVDAWIKQLVRPTRLD